MSRAQDKEQPDESEDSDAPDAAGEPADHSRYHGFVRGGDSSFDGGVGG